ncbi:MAG: serine/threonine protein kinase, partial [Planctomycetota bacterium]
AGERVSARSGSFLHVVSALFRETHHAAVLENWGVLWMLHSFVLFTLSVITHFIHEQGISSVWAYLAIWGAGLNAWAFVFWALRRRAGPVTFVERQVAHVWGGSVISCAGLFVVESILDLPTLSLSPVLGVVSGSVFLTKAAILSGQFYIQAIALYLCGIWMALVPENSLIVFGTVSALCFFIPGLQYYRRTR